MTQLTPENLSRMKEEKNIWLATTRPDGRPHLVPVWFVWDGDFFSICISGQSVKFRNLSQNPSISLALEDGSHPLICEGTTTILARPWPEQITAEFKRKYDWEIETDTEYDELVQITPLKWLTW